MNPASEPNHNRDIAAAADRAPVPGRSPDIGEIEREIERTRQRIAGELDALGDALSPEALRRNAAEAARDMRDEMIDRVKSSAGAAGNELRQLGSRGIDAVERHPLPAALFAIGASLVGVGIAANDGRKNDHRGQHTSASGSERERSGGAGNRRDPLSTLVRNPVATGIVTLIAGAAIGALLPARSNDAAAESDTRAEPLGATAYGPVAPVAPVAPDSASVPTVPISPALR